ncbi:hypothetical protein ACFL6D_02005 [Spirochaetota bacterium]
MKKKEITPFSEINPVQSKSQGVEKPLPFLDICLFNLFTPFSYENAKQIIDYMESHNLSYNISFIDIQGNEDIKKIIDTFPNIRIIFPAEKSNFIDAMNIIIKESRSNFIFALPTEMRIIDFNIQNILEKIRNNNSIFGIVPKVINNKNIPVQSIYHPVIQNKRIFLAKDDYQDNILTILPYKFSLFFDKQKFLTLQGFDAVYTNILTTFLDILYRSYTWTYKTFSCTGFTINENIGAQTSELSQFKLDSKEMIDIENFYFKNISDRELTKAFLIYFLPRLFKFNFPELKKLFKLLKKRSDTNSKRLLSDYDVLALFKSE